MKKEIVFDRNVKFRDAKGATCRVNIKICKIRTHKLNLVATHSEKLEPVKEYLVMYIVGDVNGSVGQVGHLILPQNRLQEKLLQLWDRYHMNDMILGTPEQMEVIRTIPDYRSIEIGELREKLYIRKMDILMDTKGHPVRFGEHMLVRLLPDNIVRIVNNLMDEIVRIEQEQSVLRPNLQVVDWADIEDFRLSALGRYLRLKPYATVQQVTYLKNMHYQFRNRQYIVCDSDESFGLAHKVVMKSRKYDKIYRSSNSNLYRGDWAEIQVIKRGVIKILSNTGQCGKVKTEDGELFIFPHDVT